MPMGFYNPGNGKSGDLPPKSECVRTWHELLLMQMNQIKLKSINDLYSQANY